MTPLPYGRQEITDDDVAAVVECLRDERITQGPRVELFERALAKATDAPHVVAVSSGTAALHLAVLAAGVKPGDVGITSPITFVATANCLRYAGADVVFSDVNPDNGLMDVAALEETAARLAKQGRPPRVILPVDMAGQTADLPAIRAVADRYGARVVEDAAHSLGAEYRHDGAWRRAGGCTHSDMAVLSFHPVKHITTGEGGAVTTSDAVLAARVARLRTHGITHDANALHRKEPDPLVGPWYHEQHELGHNHRLTDVQCALGTSQLTRLQSILTRRRAIAARYDAALAEEPLAGHLRPLQTEPGRRHAYHLYVVKVVAGEASMEEVARRRKSLYAFLRARDITPQVHYIPVHWQPYHARPDVVAEPLPGAAAYYAGCLSLPMFPTMTGDDVARVLDALRGWVGHPDGGDT